MEAGTVQCFEGHKRNSWIIHCGDGYYYHVREVRGNRVRLNCRQYKSRGLGCSGTASVSLTAGILRHNALHNHMPDPLLRDEYELRKRMIREAKSDLRGTKIRSILVRLKASVPNPALASRFTRVRMNSALYSARSSNYPTIPKTLLHLGIMLASPDLRPLCRTVDGADFIFKGVVGCQFKKTLSAIFVSGRMLEFLQTRESIHVDGTFKKRPKKPKTGQIFSIVVKYGDNIVGTVRVLMMRRTKEAYVEVIQFLKMIAPSFQPRRVHCDFEHAQMSAFRECFPQCRIVGCLWHYAVCVSKRARKLGLGQEASHNPLLLSIILRLCVVPLLPQYLIWRGICELWEEVEISGWGRELLPLFQYFEEEWKPRLAELSVFGDADRTNNISESDNRTLANEIPTNYPNIWFLVGSFVQLEHIAWCDKIAIDEMRPVAPGRRTSAVTNDRKVRFASQLLVNRDITPGHFLRVTSHSVHQATIYGLQLENDGTEDSDSC